MLVLIKSIKKCNFNNIFFILLKTLIIFFFLINEIFFFFKFGNYNRTNVVLLMLPQHGNLGDQAISLAEIKFLRQIFSNIKVIFNLNDYKRYIKSNSLIFLQGGGNLGWRYDFEEKNRREIIENYPNNKIIIFPQTIYFEENYKNEENISKMIYSKHKNLTIIAREKVSFNIMNKLFNNNTILYSPDIVTYLDNLIELNNINKNGALLLFRNDSERFLNKSFIDDIYLYINKLYKYVNITDTVIDKNIDSLEQAKEEVSIKLKQIASHEIVITDRLHGMIFCAITQTSCIVIRNYNHKISSSSEWFKHLDYIKFIDLFNMESFKILVNKLKNKKTKNIYNKEYFQKYYNTLFEYFLNCSHNL